MRTATDQFREKLQSALEALEGLLAAGARTHGPEAVQWLPRRWNDAADYLAKAARRGSASWMLARPEALREEDMVSYTDAGVVAEESVVTQGGFLMTRDGVMMAMWRSRRTVVGGETVDVNAEETEALCTAIGLMTILQRHRWEAWERARAAVQQELSPQERGTVRFKMKAANALWQREAVEARRGRGQTAKA